MFVKYEAEVSSRVGGGAVPMHLPLCDAEIEYFRRHRNAPQMRPIATHVAW